jgi:hypothetical protein
MPKLTLKQIEALRLVKQGSIRRTWIKSGWQFTDGAIARTAAVMALSAKALVTIPQTDCGFVDLTERGREIAALLD